MYCIALTWGQALHSAIKTDSKKKKKKKNFSELIVVGLHILRDFIYDRRES